MFRKFCFYRIWKIFIYFYFIFIIYVYDKFNLSMHEDIRFNI